MGIEGYDLSVLIRECENFIYFVEEKEIDNDCSTEEQIIINAVSNVLLAFNIANKK